MTQAWSASLEGGLRTNARAGPGLVIVRHACAGAGQLGTAQDGNLGWLWFTAFVVRLPEATEAILFDDLTTPLTTT